MVRLDLNGVWRMRKTGETGWTKAQVPGSVLNDLLWAGKIEDPFYRDNEDRARELANNDYEYERDFAVDGGLLGKDRVILCCEGLDTLAEIRLNGKMVARTGNMHRTYEFDVKEYLSEGQNKIHVIFYSPVEYITGRQKEIPTWGAGDAMGGFQHLRKAHCMFGWDWGPQMPDAGIWRDIYLKGFDKARLNDVYITQHHKSDEVILDIRVRIEQWESAQWESAQWGAEQSGMEQREAGQWRTGQREDERRGAGQWKKQRVGLEGMVTSPNGRTWTVRNEPAGGAGSAQREEHCKEQCLREEHLKVSIKNPEYWWPRGYGGQPLYTVRVALKDGDGVLLDSQNLNIGLRTLSVRQEKDRWGEAFEFNVNGVSIFAMGADYIPEDSILGRCSPERTEKLIKDCVEANFNCIRVWGGGIYPPGYFYDLCDRYGLIVWQDLMFACAVYAMTEEFSENIRREAEDNIRRIRHHASLGLWCGNNEMEWGWVEWDFDKPSKLRTDYIKQFEVLLPQTAKEIDPNTFYWPASPSSGGGFDAPNDENRGDVHYWDVWHKLKPFTDYRKYYFRFCSEFGFQSFPGLKTVKTFTRPEDRNIFSYVMEKHQKNGAANGKILYYLSENFLYPKDFTSLLYASQILQAEAIRYGVEHWRRHRGRCMGAVYWQLNDCWPVASWAGIDYYGRWKALHYYAKRFFAPVLLSACEEGTGVELHVSNETMDAVKGIVRWALKDNRGALVRQDSTEVQIPSLSSACCCRLDFGDVLMNREALRKTYLEYSLTVDGAYISGGTVLFVKPKHFDFIEPHITVDVSEEKDRYILTAKADAFAKAVELELADSDCLFGENYFDLSAGAVKKVEVMKESMAKELTLDEFGGMLMVRSVYDIS